MLYQKEDEMRFSPKSLGDKFNQTIDWMVQGKFGQDITQSLLAYQSRGKDLSNNADAESALRLLVEIKLTGSFYRPLSFVRRQQFEAHLNSFIRQHSHHLRTPHAEDELTNLVVTYSTRRTTREAAERWVKELLDKHQSLRDFTEELHAIRRAGKKGLLEDKGADLYLRDSGYFDIFPIDLHERRFLVRTGIFHAFSIPGRQDPLDYASLQDALEVFSIMHLKGKVINGVDLGSAPGIVDLLVWFYCAKSKCDICGSTPKCAACNLNDACLYYSTSIERSISLGQTMQDYGLDSATVALIVQQTQGAKRRRAGRSSWAAIRRWAQNDLNGLVQSLQHYGMDRRSARGFLKKAGVAPRDIDRYYP